MEWSIHNGKNFEAYFQRFSKKNYNKNIKGFNKFLVLFEEIKSYLEKDPINPKDAYKERLPANTKPRDDRHFMKYYFNSPLLTGAAKEGRLIYIVYIQQKVVKLLCIYTHAQFKGRPPDDELRKLIIDEEENE